LILQVSLSDETTQNEHLNELKENSDKQQLNENVLKKKFGSIFKCWNCSEWSEGYDLGSRNTRLTCFQTSQHFSETFKKENVKIWQWVRKWVRLTLSWNQIDLQWTVFPNNFVYNIQSCVNYKMIHICFIFSIKFLKIYWFLVMI
jgi:hypothetical protein